MKEKYREAVKEFRKTDRSFRRCVEKKVSSTGIYRSQHQLLMNLGRNPDCSQMELAERLDISPAAVTTTIKKLEKDGYLTREMNEEDNRFNKLRVTKKGEMVIEKSRQIFDALDKGIFDDFSEAEVDNFIQTLQKIQVNIEKINEKGDLI